MFQTISHTPNGFVQLSTFGNVTIIKAWSHGELLGDHYTTIAAAKSAITRNHKKWVEERTADHLELINSLYA